MKTGRLPPSPIARQAIVAASLMMAWQVAAKATRDSLFLSAFQPSALPAVVGASAVCSLLMAVLSARLFRRFGPFRLIPAAYLLGGLLHGVEWMLLPSFPRPVSAFIYIHVIALGSVLLSGFWAIANERFDPREARRRFGQIMAFGTVGGLVGGLMAERVATLGSSADLLVLLAILQLACAITLFRFAPARAAEKAAEVPSFPEVISGAPYLIALAAFVLLTSMCAGTLDYLFKFQAASEFGRGPALSRFFALFYAITSVLTFAVQAGISPFWLKHFGPGRTVAALPVAVTGASLLSLFAPGGMVIVSRAIEQLLRGSLFRSGYELFYTPMPQAEKRSSKSVIDIGADRLGDGLAAATIQLLLTLPAGISARVILAVTAMLSGMAAWLAFRLDRAYVAVLEKGLKNHTVKISPEEAEDLVTQTVVLRTLPWIAQAGGEAGAASLAATAATPAAYQADASLRQLAELRSGDPRRVRPVLQRTDPLDPILVPQVIELLGRDDVARLAHEALLKIADRIAGQLVDRLEDESTNLKIRRRIPRILASCHGAQACDGLFRRLRDERFDLRVRCARALEKTLQHHPEFRPEKDAVFEIVGRELSVSQKVWRNREGTDPGGSDSRLPMVDEVLRERASNTLAHISTLLGLVLPAQSIRLAFRALHTDDVKLRGVALEYLDSVLPRALREQLAAQIEGPIPARKATQTEEALANLLESSPSIMARLEEKGFDAPARKGPEPGDSPGLE